MKILDDKTIYYLKTHKDLITQELLDELRKTKEGKQVALDILDIEQDDESYYLDAFGNRITFNGNRGLKKQNTKLNLAPIHVSEMKRCYEDIGYFRDNYIKIKTPKDGVSFPDLRPYQNRIIDALAGDGESYVVLSPRQSGKSITVGTWLSWHFVFNKDINVGICANRGAMAHEFLYNVKNMILALPIWMSPGIKAWNVSSITADNGMRILTDVPSADSFRGFTCAIIVVDEAAYIPSPNWDAFIDGVMPSQSSLSWKKNVFLSTANGMNHFYNLVKGAKQRKEVKDLTQEELEAVKQKSKVLDIKKYDDRYDVTVDEPSNGHTFIEVDWKEVPRYDSKGNVVDPDDFKQSVIDKFGTVYFNQAYANCLGGNTKVFIRDKCNSCEEITLADLYTYMRNGFWQSLNLEILTASGWSTFDGVRKIKSETYSISTNKFSLTCSYGHRFRSSGKFVIAGCLRSGTIIDGNTPDDDAVVYNISKSGYSDLYDIVGTKDATFISNGVVSHNCFIGSSYTLIDASCLERLHGDEPVEVRDGMLNVFRRPQSGHKYIMSVDPSKDGADGFAVTVLDITRFPFEQVAACSLQVDYFKMPEYLNEWGMWYNTAFLIIENNEGAGQSIADMLKQDYEYENLFSAKGKRYPGFRTTPRTRKLILNTMKMFMENDNLNIHDGKLINEFYSFILVNGKYQADEGYHDDRVMSLALAFAPFTEVNNFSEAKGMIDKFYSSDSGDSDFTDYLTIGYFDY